MDPDANTPVRPLEERGWVDLVLHETGETEARMDVTFVLDEDGESTVASAFSITYLEDTASGSFNVTGEGEVGTVAFDVERRFTYGEEGLYEILVSFGGQTGLLAASLEAPFDPVTEEDTGNPQFVGSALTTIGHYLLVESGVGLETGILDGTVEADDEIVLDVAGTTTAPTFQLPTGEDPALPVQTKMAERWAALWGLLGDGVSLVAVLEDLYR